MDHLRIYLNDHLGGSTGGMELARRVRDNNEGNAYGEALTPIAAEIEEDRSALLAVMADLGVSEDRVKVAGGWAGEKISRLKPSGGLTEYTPLARLIELEGLCLGVAGKASLWRGLEAAGPKLAGRTNSDFAELAERAEKQRAELEALRLEAAAEAFAD